MRNEVLYIIAMSSKSMENKQKEELIVRAYLRACEHL